MRILFRKFQQTNASIQFSREIDVMKNRSVDATVQIQNSTDFISTIQIMGVPLLKFEDVNDLGLLFEHKFIKPRSSALICTEQIQREQSHKEWIFKFGTRKPGDFLVHFQNEYGIVKKLKRPEITFDFQDSQVNITYLVLTSNVSSNWKKEL